jgi:hypothetical protein
LQLGLQISAGSCLNSFWSDRHSTVVTCASRINGIKYELWV